MPTFHHKTNLAAAAIPFVLLALVGPMSTAAVTALGALNWCYALDAAVWKLKAMMADATKKDTP